MNSRRRTVLAFGVALALLVVFLTASDPRRVVAELAGVSLPVFALGLAASLLSLVCWSEATRVLLGAVGTRASPGRFFAAFLAGTFSKQVLPFGHAGGPAFVAFAVRREADQSYERTLAAVTAAEGLSLAASFLLAAVGLLAWAVLTPPSHEVRVLEVGVGLAAAVFLGLAAVVVTRRDVVRAGVGAAAFGLRATLGRFSTRVAAGLAPDALDERVAGFYATFDAVAADRAALVASFALAAVGWVCFSLPLYTALLSLGVHVSPVLVLFLVPTSGLVSTVPLPGGLGAVELALTGLLTGLAAVAVPEAATAVLLFRAATYWFVVLVSAGGSAYASVSGAGRSRGSERGGPD